MTDYEATPAQWRQIENSQVFNGSFQACVLELRSRVEKLELGAEIYKAVANEVGRMYSMPIPDRWYWIRESADGDWFPAFYHKTVGWTNGDTWEDWDKQVVQWHLIPLPPSEFEQKGDADD
jgi:hypothetical protein